MREAFNSVHAVADRGREGRTQVSAAPQPHLDVCASCGRMFARVYVQLCNACAVSEENRFLLVREFLRENPGRSISEVADATGLSRGEISKFYEQKRLVEVDPGPGEVPTKCTCALSVSGRCPYCRMQLSQKLGEMRQGTFNEEGSRGGGNSGMGGGASGGGKNSDGSGRVHYVRRFRRTGE